MSQRVETELKKLLPSRGAQLAWVVLIAVLVATYVAELSTLIRVWRTQPDYGHGFFVPVFSLVLLYLRRGLVDPLPDRGSWWGVAFLVLAALLRLGTAYFNYVPLARLSILPCLAGITLIIGGWRGFRWAWPSIAYLIFMIPLPGAVAGALRQPLQTLGTKASVFVIQTLGIPAAAQGNIIRLTESELGVVEACSGLRMLMLFFAICIGAALVLRSELWEKVLIALSAIPIAVISNVARISLTAILYEIARKWPNVMSTETAEWVFHDMAGVLMMPLAMLLLWGEMALLSKLFFEPVSTSSLGMSLAGGGEENIGRKKATNGKGKNT